MGTSLSSNLSLVFPETAKMRKTRKFIEGPDGVFLQSKEVRCRGPAPGRPPRRPRTLPVPGPGGEGRGRRLQHATLGFLLGVKGHAGGPLGADQEAPVRLPEL